MPELPLEIDCRSVQASLADGDDLLLVDCRERDEYELVRIDGARLMPLSEIAEHLADLAPHRDRPIAVYCHHGQRSLCLVDWLRGQGFSRAQSITGGIDRWAQEIDPHLPRY